MAWSSISGRQYHFGYLWVTIRQEQASCCSLPCFAEYSGCPSRQISVVHFPKVCVGGVYVYPVACVEHTPRNLSQSYTGRSKFVVSGILSAYFRVYALARIVPPITDDRSDTKFASGVESERLLICRTNLSRFWIEYIPLKVIHKLS